MMTDTISIQSKKVQGRQKWLIFIDWLLPFYIVCTVPLFYLGLRYEFLFKAGTILVTLFYILRFGIGKSKAAKTFTVFCLLVALSFIQYTYNERPFICYINDASNYLAAMLYFYVGITDDRPGRTFYNKMMFSIAIVFILGLFCYVTTPPWYIDRNVEIMSQETGVEYGENSMLEALRFGAFFGDSYSVSHLSVFCSAVALFAIAYTQGRDRIIAIVCLIVGLVSSITSMHRASILGSVIAIVMYVYFNLKTDRHKANTIVILLSIFVVLALFMFLPSTTERVGDIAGMVTERVDDNMDLNKALQERKFTKELMSGMKFFVFGHGLGSGGGSVRAFGFPGITDMQYIKMFYENGFVGAVLFILIILRTIMRGVKYIRYYLTEIIIVLFILAAMMGSNSLSIYYFIVFPFWYAVGRINNSNYLQKVKRNEEWI